MSEPMYAAEVMEDHRELYLSMELPGPDRQRTYPVEVRLCDIDSKDLDVDTWRKIGHLWAAAPDLLIACEAALALLTGTGQNGTLGHHRDNPVPTMPRAAIDEALDN